jgi:hypothetical protein
MITTQEIETALINAGFDKEIKEDYINWSYMGSLIDFNVKLSQYTSKIMLNFLLCQMNLNQCYCLKKRYVEYGTIDYGINELIEDLRSWL